MPVEETKKIVRAEVLRNLVRVPEKYVNFRPHPVTTFKLYQKDGKLFYRKFFVVDIRWSHYAWQQNCEKLHLTKNKNTVTMYIEKMPRRHGKTYKFSRQFLPHLMSIPLPYPIMAVYCPEANQSLRNAWRGFEQSCSQIPNARLLQSEGKIIIPRPRLGHETDHVTIYLLGMRGGSGAKKGNYYDVVIVDEADQADEVFIKEVCIISCLDRHGITYLTGTEDDNGNLDVWLDGAKKREMISTQLDRGVAIPPDKIPDDLEDWSYQVADAESLGVYSTDELRKIKAKIGDDLYNRQFMCISKQKFQRYYFRAEMEKAEANNQVLVNLPVIPKVHLRAYFDLGIGNKSDRMAFIVTQNMPGQLRVVWAADMPNADYSEILHLLQMFPHWKSIFEICLPHDVGARQQSDKEKKRDIFDTTARTLGFSCPTRVLTRSHDRTADLGRVRMTIPQTVFDALNAGPVIEALKNHSRRRDNQTKLYLDTPAKTKYRDLADAFRYAAVDYYTKEYLSYDGNSFRARQKRSGIVYENGVEHTFSGSIIYDNQGRERPPQGVPNTLPSFY